MSNAKNRKNLKPCRGFKSFRLLAFRIQFLKKRIFGSSNPSTRRKIDNGYIEIRKKLGAKKAEKSLEISAFLAFSRSDINRPKDLYRAAQKDITRKSLRYKGFRRFLMNFSLLLRDLNKTTGILLSAKKDITLFSRQFAKPLYYGGQKVELVHTVTHHVP